MKRFAFSLLLLAAACSQDSTDLDYPITPSSGAIGGVSDQGGSTGTNGGGVGSNPGTLTDAGVGLGDGGPVLTDSGVGTDADTTGLPTGIDAGPDTDQDMTPPLPDQIP